MLPVYFVCRWNWRETAAQPRSRPAVHFSSLGIVFFVVLILGLIFIGVLASMIIQVEDKLPVYKANLTQIQQDVSAWFAQRNIDIGGLTSGSLSGDKIFSYASSILSSMLSSMKNSTTP